MKATKGVAVLIACGTTTFMTACSPQKPPTPPDTRAADEAAILATDNAWSKGAEAKDVDEHVRYYTEDAVVLPPNEPMAIGKEAIHKVIGDIFAMPGFSVKWQPAKAEVARSGDIGYTYGAYQMTFNDPEGKLQTDRGKYTVVWKKQADGSWKSAVEMFSSDLPPSPPPK